MSPDRIERVIPRVPKAIAWSVERPSGSCSERIPRVPGISNLHSALSLRGLKCSRSVPVA